MEHSGKITNVKTMISCKHVSKTFENNGKRNEVLKDISLEVAENEFVVILGPGQCGKTTLVNIMAGLECGIWTKDGGTSEEGTQGESEALY